MKRQAPASLPVAVPVTLPASLPVGALTTNPNNTARATRENSMDDQVEDMDFSAHEVDESEDLEEDF
jgi:hypothetical protein